VGVTATKTKTNSKARRNSRIAQKRDSLGWPLMNIHHRRYSAALMMILLAATNEAQAVDLVNSDSVPREVVVNKADGASDVITLAPRQKVNGICESCVVLLDKSSVEATGSVTVRIEDGEVSIDAK